MDNRPTRDYTLMEIARITARRSTCPRANVGAVMSRDGRILSTGYNGAPAGMLHCNHIRDEPCRKAVHAEANLVAFAAKYGVATDGAEVHTTLGPCLACSQLLINCGIIRVVIDSDYRDPAGVNLLQGAGVETILYPNRWEGHPSKHLADTRPLPH